MSRPSRASSIQRLSFLILSAVLLQPHLTFGQTLLASNLPSCAQTCAQLQNAQSSCTPAGGAPVSSDAIYKSCFCQSALLTQLKQPQSSQFCTQCSSSDMATIQTWYQSYCNSDALPSGGGQSSATSASGSGGQAATSIVQQAPSSSIAQVQNNPTQTAGATVTNPQDIGNSDPDAGKPWIQTHWKWIVMLVVLVVGLSAFTLIFALLHRRYHARREAQWGQSTVSHPDINTWGPGQSVHDVGFVGGLKRTLSRKGSKGKGKRAEQEKTGGSPSRNAAGGGNAYGYGGRAAEVVPPVPVLTGEKAGRFGYGGSGGPPHHYNSGGGNEQGRGDGGMF